jgi:DNA-binding transcriptional LysR family regulator
MPVATLDVDAVQAFVLVADLGSFTKAAQALDTSQAAISVKVKRLEDRLGYRLLERTPRNVRLSNQGMTFLKPARNFIAAHELAVAGLTTISKRLVIGISDQVAGHGLPGLLARLNAYDPALIIEVRIDASRNLVDAFDRGALDAAIVRRTDDRRDGELLIREHFGWFASPNWEHGESRPLRLAFCHLRVGRVFLPPRCSTRQVYLGQKYSSAAVWQQLEQPSQPVWQLRPWHPVWPR